MANLRAGAVVIALCLLGGPALLAESAAAGPCDPPVKAIACENTKAGNPASEWDVSGSGDSSIQGFATDISVDQGQTVRFKVDTPSADYRIDVYRMGYYGGSGARKVATVQPSVSLPQSQPPCAEEASTGLIDCGTWKESASWAVPASAVSGIYFAKLVREDTGSGGSHVIFVVRDDDGKSDLLFQTSDSTWQAYNRYGGRSLYTGGPGTNPGRAYAVSYNRPLTVRGPVPEDSPFNAEYPMVRWLERNGYEVSYTTDVDSDRRGAEILEHKAFLSVGHDEYWSAQQRSNVEAARAAGVHLAFFSGNEIFWKTRWRTSADGANTPYRTLVSYKETHASAKIDPLPSVWTGTWRDPRLSPPADGGRPENALSGTAFAVNAGTTEIQVPAEDGKMRIWRETDVASLDPGQVATLGEDTLGYEWDEAPADGSRPPGLIHLSTRTANVSQKLLDYGSNYGSGPVTHHMTLYRAASGALVFGAGTIQWSWGLDGVHDRGSAPPDSRMQQATANLLSDMGAQPATLQGGLVPPLPSADEEAPTATIAAPVGGAEVEVGEPIAISGTAADAGGEGGEGGAVGGVEVSVDGGATWRPAEGREDWTFSWTPEGAGEATIVARAIDDSGNIQAPGDEVEVNVAAAACPCTIWDSSFTGSQDSDKAAIEVGVKFRADTSGYITGLRFYRTSGNTGTHVGRLWAASGAQLAVVTFSGETTTGWQQVRLDKPVPIDAGTTYVASYHAPNGHYASIAGYFSVVGADNPPLHALASGVDGPNGIYRYGSAGGLFSGGGPSTFNSENYLVDVVFEDELAPDTTPPAITSRSPIAGGTEVSAEISPSATFDEQIDPATVDGARVELRDPSNAPIAGNVSYDAVQRQIAFDPSASLQPSTTYTVRVKGGPTGVADVAGNRLAADSTWSFTTVSPPPPPPDEGPGGPILVIANTSNPFSRYYGEILQAEGLNEYTITDISSVTPALLSSRDVAILGEGALSAAQATTLGNWVQGGGNLIAMRPDGDLIGLLGLAPAGGTLANAYIRANTATSPGAGIVGQTIQFHGSADRYTLNGAQAVATLYSTSSASTPNPAVTLRSIGANGGHAAAFTYDLARSIVYTRQGNPAWSKQERDGLSPIRSDDLFFGAKAGDTQPDWVDFNKIAIPQADEQQRLLTNLIGEMNLDRKPLPRFWFLPRDEKAAVVMSGDDHARNGTQGRFEHFKTLDPPGCVAAKWECVRATSYVFPDTPITDGKAGQLASEGFEIALHAWTGCENWDDREDLEDLYAEQLESFAAEFPSLPAPTTNRTHCIVWSDWATQPKVELENGMRLDTTYYYWPAAWVQNRPGMFTGSGMPMRFADLDGSLIDVYQAATQMTDESNQAYPFTADALLDKALGPEGYYGVFTANIHTDEVEAPEADAIVASAQARGVPVVSARQMLTWLDGRNQSSFDSIAWSGDELGFTIDPGPGATGLRAMVPTTSAVGPLEAIARGGAPVATTTQTVKGVEYAFFDAVAGSYTAAYVDESLPLISNVQVAPGAGGTATVTWDTDEPTDSRVDYGTDPGSLDLSVGKSALVTSHSIQLTGLNPGATYYFRVTSADGEANAATSPNPPLGPQGFATIPPPPMLSSTAPPSPANQNSPKVMGSASAGSTVRVYSSPDCSGPPLATVTAAELATGVAIPVADNSTTSLRATAASSAGTSACSAPLGYVEDSSPPTALVDSGPAALSNLTEATFAFSGTDPGGSGVTFQCRLDSSSEAAWAACASGQKYAALSSGPHKFEVRAVDAAGNADATPAAHGWIVDSVSPDTQITGQPPALTNATAASLSFAGDDGSGSGIGSFECRIDSAEAGAWVACASAHAYSDLAEGAHKFEVRALDNAGNADATPAIATWQIDLTAPSVTIDSISKGLLGAGESADLGWRSSENGSFQLRLGGSDCDTGTVLDSGSYAAAPAAQGSSLTAAQLQEGSNALRLCLADGAGNRGQAVTAIAKDTKEPDTQITVMPATLVQAQTASFSFTGDDSGGSGVVSFECRIDSDEPGAWEACASGQSYSSLSEGSHDFEVRAIDKAGNADGTPAAAEWRVDATAPETAIDGGPSAIADSATANFAFHGEDPGGSGVESLQCRRDSSEAQDWQPCTSPLKATSLAEGSHSIEIRAIDRAGNVDATPASFTWIVDTKAPETAITAKPAALVNGTAASFSFAGEDTDGSGMASLECRRDSSEASAWKPCTSALVYSDLTEGSHEFEVRAIDKAGNVDASPAIHTWQIDITPPVVSIDSGPSGLTNDPTPTFIFGSEAGATFECSIDAGMDAFGPCSGATSHTPASALPDGSRTLRVRATDHAGNRATATRDFEVDTAAPQAPVLTGSAPSSPANDNTPEIAGSAPAGTTIRLYSGSDCSGSPLATAPVSQLEAGITVTVADDSTTSFRATATTAAGNTSGCSEALAYVEDSAAPGTSIDSGPAALTGSAAASFDFRGEDPGGSGLAGFECRLDSAEPAGWEPCSSPSAHTGLAAGPHGFEVRAIDQAGNADGSPATRVWQIDLTTPVVSIDSGPDGLTNDPSPTFAFGSETGATFECSIDTGSADFGPCAGAGSHTPASPLPDGSHIFRVRATDQAGNQAVATRSFALDATEPQTQITAKPAALSDVAIATFAFGGDDSTGSGVASYQCRLDSTEPTAWEACASPRAYAGLADGPHDFEVRAIDTAGNADRSPAAFPWTIDMTPTDDAGGDPALPGPPTPTPAGTARFVRVTHNVREGTAVLVFDVPGPGQMSMRAEVPETPPGARKNVQAMAKARQLKLRQRGLEPAVVEVARAGMVEVPIELTAGGRKLLQKAKAMRVKLLIRFKALDGSTATWKIAVVLKKDNAALEKGKRQASP